MDRNDLDKITKERNRIERTASIKKYQESSRKRLVKIVRKKMTTSFIGDIARVEKYFGKLWGIGKAESECTPQELEWREIWEDCRTEILNNGNHQIRSVENEIGEYGVVWNRYHTTLSPNEDNGTDED